MNARTLPRGAFIVSRNDVWKERGGDLLGIASASGSARPKWTRRDVARPCVALTPRRSDYIEGRGGKKQISINSTRAGLEEMPHTRPYPSLRSQYCTTLVHFAYFLETLFSSYIFHRFLGSSSQLGCCDVRIKFRVSG